MMHANQNNDKCLSLSFLQGFHTSMYSSSWFLTLFASTLPLCASFRIMDIFLIDGIEIIFRVGLALLERSQNELLKLDMEDMTKVSSLYQTTPIGTALDF